MDVYTQDDWKRFGRLVTQTRIDKGYMTAKELAESMSVTPRVIGDLENGRRSNYGAATLRKLEIALGWGPKSVYAVLGGGAPVEVEGQRAVEVSRLQVESERAATLQLELSKESTEELIQGIRRRVDELRRRVDHADELLAQQQAPAARQHLHGSAGEEEAQFKDDYDLVADDAYGYSHEDEDELREMEP